ncbi:uncharacterized protein LOC135487941 [Lineus longissimus]|uniref:uncharacterized protein LOC135487941 n=1 Tax=Lineus longissimus TaxID=88925 RepID=UPI00315C73EF
MPNFSENPSFNSQRVQKASRINGIESTRLGKQLQILEKEKQTHLRMNFREMRLLKVTLDHIKASSGKSPEGIADDEEFVEKKGDIVSCFLYGDRTQSRRFGKYRRVQSAAAPRQTTLEDEEADVKSLKSGHGRKADAATGKTTRPHTSPGHRRSIVWGGRTIPIHGRTQSFNEQAPTAQSELGLDSDSDSAFEKQADDSEEDDVDAAPTAQPTILNMPPRRFRNISVSGNAPLPVPFSNNDPSSIDEEVKDLGEVFRHKASMRERTISNKRQSSASEVSIVKSTEKRQNLAKVVNQARALTMAVSKWRRLSGMPGVERPPALGDDRDGESKSVMTRALDNQRRKSLMGKIESFMDQYPITQES